MSPTLEPVFAAPLILWVCVRQGYDFVPTLHFVPQSAFCCMHVRSIYASSTQRLSPLLPALQGEGGEGVGAELPADGPATVGCHTRMHDLQTQTVLQWHDQGRRTLSTHTTPNAGVELNCAQASAKQKHRMSEKMQAASSE